jgi:RNA polymerase sigma factor (sigma-70 family)
MEPRALGQLLEEHGAALALFARQWCRSPEDIVQEAFIRLSAERVPPLNPVGWLYRAVRNGAISAWRSERRRTRHESVAAGRAPAWFLPAEGSRLDQEQVVRELSGLPVETREVIVAHLWGGRSFNEIGELTGVSTSTAHRTYAAGLATLRERMADHPCPNHRPKHPA